MILDDLHKSNQHSIRPSPGHVLPISAFSLQSEAADYRDDDTCVRDQSPRCPHGLFLWSSVATTSRIHLYKFEICIFSDQLKCTQTTSTFSCIPVGSWELGVGGFPYCTRGFPFPLSKVHNTSCVTKAKRFMTAYAVPAATSHVCTQNPQKNLLAVFTRHSRSNTALLGRAFPASSYSSQ